MAALPSRRMWLLGGALIVFSLIFAWAYLAGTNGDRQSNSVVVMRQGSYRVYDYTATFVVGKKDRMVSFRPSLPHDEALVLDVMRRLARDLFGDDVTDQTIPVVETVDEGNYVTFSLPSAKLYFQTYRNDRGEVGSMTFWRESLRPEYSFF